MKNATSLYMFAIVPPQHISYNIHMKRVEFYQRYHFNKALKPPVHITLLDPFLLQKEWSAAFEYYTFNINNWAQQQHPFQIDLCNYNFFENAKHPVVFIDVVKSQRLNNFHSDFIDELAKQRLASEGKRTFNPHITIGYRDTTLDAFPDIKNYYSQQTFSNSFTCDCFYLWKHNGANWQTVRKYMLYGETPQLSLF